MRQRVVAKTGGEAESARFADADVFHEAAERFPGMLAIVAADGTGLYFNPSLLAYFGAEPDAVDGSRWFLHIHPEERTRVVRTWRRSLRERQAFRTEVQIMHPETRSYRLFVVDGAPLGDVAAPHDAWVVTCTDVQHVRDTEAALEDTSAHLQSIFETSRNSLFLCDVEGHVVAVNPAARERIRVLYGHEVQPGALLSDLLPSSRGSAAHRAFERALAGEASETEYAVTGTDGRVIWFHLSCVPVVRGSEVTGVSLSAMDMTERKRAEEQRREQEASLRARREQVERSLRNMASELEDLVAERTVALRREIAERKAAEADLDVLRQRLVAQGERERVALANGLHDDVLQEVLGLHMNLSHLVSTTLSGLDAQEVHDELRQTLLGLRGIADSLRRTIRGIKPAALEEFGLRSALQGFSDGLVFRDAQEIVFDFDDVGPLPEALQLCLYRVGQETIRNAVKHAQATRIVASLRRQANALILHICDDGIGFKVPQRISSLVRGERFGLAGISEHVTSAGGTLDVSSVLGGGTVVEARFTAAFADVGLR